MNWLKPNKAHRHDMIRINMLKRQRSSLCNPLGLIYYPNTPTQIKDYSLMFGKTIKSIPVHKKPVSLSYWFVENLYSTTLFYIENNLVSQNQLGFKLGNYFVN